MSGMASRIRPDRETPSEHRVLVVDDDPAVASIIKTSIRSLGGHCLAVTDSTDLIGLIATFSPSHIVLDLFMPGQSGLGVIKSLAAAGIETPIILSSGADRRLMEAAARSASEQGLRVPGLLPKPYTRRQLEEVLAPLAPNRTEVPRDNAQHGMPKRLTKLALEEAILAREIVPAFQPKVACRSGEVIGFEVLARWRHPEMGFIAPDQFIPLAEQHGTIGHLTLSIASSALDWIGAHDPSGHLTLAINISPCLLKDGAFSTAFIAMCGSRGIALDRIIFEVTESSTLSPGVATLDLLTELRIKGIGLSLDDFGIGYSSLRQLARIPFSEVKVDRSFVMSAARSQEARTIVAAIAGLAGALGMTTVAEGVEDAETAALLTEIGCSYAQGYHFGRPMLAEDARRWLAKIGAGSSRKT